MKIHLKVEGQLQSYVLGEEAQMALVGTEAEFKKIFGTQGLDPKLMHVVVVGCPNATTSQEFLMQCAEGPVVGHDRHEQPKRGK